jgi:hypothetical protein
MITLLIIIDINGVWIKVNDYSLLRQRVIL